MNGVPTPDHVVAEFRARFLYSGNASAVSRQLALKERTGREIAARLEEDPSFAVERRKLRESALERHVAMRLRVAEVASERFESDHFESAPSADGVPTVVIDKRADYGRLVIDAEKNAHNLARFDAERSGAMPAQGTVTINVSPTPEATERLAEEAAGKPGD